MGAVAAACLPLNERGDGSDGGRLTAGAEPNVSTRASDGHRIHANARTAIMLRVEVRRTVRPAMRRGATQLAPATLAARNLRGLLMLDLHCHMLPGIDDGAVDLEMALAMARMAVADGIHTVACSPHIYPGLYENDATGIRAAVRALQVELDAHGIALRLLDGADVHLEPGLASAVRSGRVPTLAGSRYLLLEPPHHVAPPRLEETVFDLLVDGLVPVITHPERLTWIEDQYPVFERLVKGGAWMQLTAGSLTGRFGRRPQYWAERMLDEGLAHVLATDAHHPRRRPPLLAEGRTAAAARVGEREAEHLVVTRPLGIIQDSSPERMPTPPGRQAPAAPRWQFWQRRAQAS